MKFFDIIISICPMTFKNTIKGWNQKVWNDIKNQINDNIMSLIESLNSSMQNSIEKQKTEDNW